MASRGETFASVLTAIAVLAATVQALIMWEGRNSHIELNLHSQLLEACARVIATAGPLLSNAGALADYSGSLEDQSRIAEARLRVARYLSDVFESLSVIELVGSDTIAKQAASLAVDIQNFVNNTTGRKQLDDQPYLDLRTGLASSVAEFRLTCREALGAR